MHKTLTVTLVAGGSGGHIFPALSVLQSLRQLRPDMRGCLVTTRHPRDQRAIASLPQLVRDAQVHLEFLPRMPTKWYGQLASAPMLWSAANKMLDQMQPHVVIGFGGWLTVPFLMAARLRKTTTVLH
jgi:UDP-N-acetylglucosamine--N-acetylmuramyl-(pentapeptide) pyrophosphoryl-undecaprenol N-acetylglucosamine transferase